MNVTLALTASDQGADVANHVAVTALINAGGKVVGAELEDRFTGERFAVEAAVVVNATGPFADAIRKMDDPAAPTMLTASSGAHIVLDADFSPPGTGLLIPETDDGRVLFLLPWMGATLIGTTDQPAEIVRHPKATEDDIDYILRHVERYFSIPVDRSDVRAAWSGLRPLVSDPNAADTARLSRDHVLNVSESGLLTIAGGKWTTYRKMALDTVDHAVRHGRLSAKGGSRTEGLKLVGAETFSGHEAGELQERFGLSADVSSHLAHAYGDRAGAVAELAAHGLDAPLAEGYPYLQAEVVYGAREEFAQSTVDVLARRARLGFLDRDAVLAAVPVVSGLLAAELGWNDDRSLSDRTEAIAYFV
jgi:glycerol-3-phosphate dehydrogenase